MESIQITRPQLAKILSLTKMVSEDSIEKICPALYDMLLEKSNYQLKNMLGRYIFHLQQVDRLNTTIGLQKLLEGGLTAVPDETLAVLAETCEEGQDLAEEIKIILG
ncbi:MAG: hypothetical protein ACTSU5_19880 [Promethearchaeota archaeon]